MHEVVVMLNLDCLSHMSIWARRELPAIPPIGSQIEMPVPQQWVDTGDTLDVVVGNLFFNLSGSIHVYAKSRLSLSESEVAEFVSAGWSTAEPEETIPKKPRKR